MQVWRKVVGSTGGSALLISFRFQQLLKHWLLLSSKRIKVKGYWWPIYWVAAVIPSICMGIILIAVDLSWLFWYKRAIVSFRAVVDHYQFCHSVSDLHVWPSFIMFIFHIANTETSVSSISDLVALRSVVSFLANHYQFHQCVCDLFKNTCNFDRPCTNTRLYHIMFIFHIANAECSSETKPAVI
jgi:hypothetical protein